MTVITTGAAPVKATGRRDVLRLLAAGAGFGFLQACSQNTATGRNQLILVSDAQLEEMSAGAWRDLQAKTPIWRDSQAQRRLETIGARVAQASGQTSLNWEFIAFDSPQINAFVLPGGKVGFFRGLMEVAGDDAEIAAVMGHEAGHVVARHAAERFSQQMAVNAGVALATVALSGELGQWADEAAAALGMGVMVGVLMPYSRDHELEADRLGVDLMAQAAYEPRAAVQFWTKMMGASAQREKPLELLSTHPSDDTRMAALEKHIATLI
jgi:predicted Zn-dependent protease